MVDVDSAPIISRDRTTNPCNCRKRTIHFWPSSSGCQKMLLHIIYIGDACKEKIERHPLIYFIGVDLTELNQHLYFTARKDCLNVSSVWSMDGKIFVKRTDLFRLYSMMILITTIRCDYSLSVLSIKCSCMSAELAWIDINFLMSTLYCQYWRLCLYFHTPVGVTRR